MVSRGPFENISLSARHSIGGTDMAEPSRMTPLAGSERPHAVGARLIEPLPPGRADLRYPCYPPASGQPTAAGSRTLAEDTAGQAPLPDARGVRPDLWRGASRSGCGTRLRRSARRDGTRQPRRKAQCHRARHSSPDERSLRHPAQPLRGTTSSANTANPCWNRGRARRRNADLPRL